MMRKWVAGITAEMAWSAPGMLRTGKANPESRIDLFTSKDWNEGYNELVILVTPEILKSVEQTLQMMDTQQ